MLVSLGCSVCFQIDYLKEVSNVIHCIQQYLRIMLEMIEVVYPTTRLSWGSPINSGYQMHMPMLVRSMRVKESPASWPKSSALWYFFVWTSLPVTTLQKC
jgi:hypothetical protein